MLGMLRILTAELLRGDATVNKRSRAHKLIPSPVTALGILAFLCLDPWGAPGPRFAWRHHPGGSVLGSPAADDAGNPYVASAEGRSISLSPEGDL